ncbi:hypothetical protein KVT40_005955 [Elsinoe batatas]|uniref:Metallo-beta-lactamase domain-containing protein n=1 Tax=Elsinoe batatas TaxID=2601811 RepID=A0A8K0KZB8_9PEZI|nr:hypothetical protein KVT40_005955 [Elsinoe batatas]
MVTAHPRDLLDIKKVRDATFAQFWARVGPMFEEGDKDTAVPHLVSQATGVVVELGPGTGAQLPYFDKTKVTKIYGLEPNAGLHVQLRDRVKTCGLAELYQLVPHGIEDIDKLEKVGDLTGTVDTIISVQVLCSIPQLDANLRRLYTLLKPGGQLIVYEHVKNQDPVTYLVQRLYSVIWPFFVGNCHLTCDTFRSIMKIGDWSRIDMILPKPEETSTLFPRIHVIHSPFLQNCENKVMSESSVTRSIPQSDVCFEVSIIDTTTNIVCHAPSLIQPTIKNHEYLHLPTYAFLLKHPSGRNLLFDLGGRKDWRNLAPGTVNALETRVTNFDITSNVSDILNSSNVDLASVTSIILSHWHWDHVGDPSTFPKTTSLIVGPGFRKSFMPGYPSITSASLLDTDFEGREVEEIKFIPSLNIGGFAAHDLLGDGSIFILDTAGHTVGHISALVRTTANTFVFLGGDICHNGGVIRPTPLVQMPDTIPGDIPLLAYPNGCPCSIFTACHPDPDEARKKPYFEVSRDNASWYEDPEVAHDSVTKLQAFDADENVLVAIAHDEGIGRVCDMFPKGTVNDWQSKGWKQRIRWGFLNALPVEGHTVRGKIWAL